MGCSRFDSATRGHDGQIYEASGSHCSCYGFEDQWDPKATSPVYLLSDNFSFSVGGYDDNASENKSAVKARLVELFKVTP